MALRSCGDLRIGGATNYNGMARLGMKRSGVAPLCMASSLPRRPLPWSRTQACDTPLRAGEGLGVRFCGAGVRFPCAQLALGVLRRLAGTLEAVLLALLHARVAREEAGLAQGRPEGLVRTQERPRHAMAHRASLAAHTSADHLHRDVEARRQLEQPQWALGLCQQHVAPEILLGFAAVHYHAAVAIGKEPHTRHGGLAPARAGGIRALILRQRVSSACYASSATACWRAIISPGVGVVHGSGFCA